MKHDDQALRSGARAREDSQPPFVISTMYIDMFIITILLVYTYYTTNIE